MPNTTSTRSETDIEVYPNHEPEKILELISEHTKVYRNDGEEKGLPVKFTDGSSSITPDGEVRINPEHSFKNGEKLGIPEEERLRLMLDTLSHEVEHFNESDLNSKKEFVRNRYPTAPKLAGMVMNVVEDAYIDYKRLNRYPGLKKPFDMATEATMAQWMNIDESEIIDAMVKTLTVTFRNGKRPKTLESDYLNEFGEKCEKWYKRTIKADKQEERCDIAEKIVATILNEVDEEPGELPDELEELIEEMLDELEDEVKIRCGTPSPDEDVNEVEKRIEEESEDMEEEPGTGEEDDGEEDDGEETGADGEEIDDDSDREAGDSEESEGDKEGSEDGESDSEPDSDGSGTDSDGEDSDSGSTGTDSEGEEESDGEETGDGSSSSSSRTRKTDSEEPGEVETVYDDSEIGEFSTEKFRETEFGGGTDSVVTVKPEEIAGKGSRKAKTGAERLSNEVAEILEEMEEKEAKRTVNRDRGKDLDVNRAIRYMSGDKSSRDIYEKEIRDEPDNRAVGVTIDASGSMRGREMRNALEAVGAIGKATDILGDDFTANTFWSTRKGGSKMDGENTGVSWINRIEEEFDMDALEGVRTHHREPIPVGLRNTRKELRKSDVNGEKIIFVLHDGNPTITSDGYPYNENGISEKAVQETKEEVRKTRQLDFTVIGIAVGKAPDSERLDTMFGAGNWFRFNSEELADKLLTIYRNQ